MDYANRQRVKLWGTARVVEDDAGLLERLREGSGGTEFSLFLDLAKRAEQPTQHNDTRETPDGH